MKITEQVTIEQMSFKLLLEYKQTLLDNETIFDDMELYMKLENLLHKYCIAACEDIKKALTF